MKRAYLDEDQVLKPVDPAITDDNDWPIFHIHNADVYVSDIARESISLLRADFSRPVTVTGKLEKVARGQNSSLTARGILPVSIQIHNVERFAYGQFEDGDVAFWAAGKAGWFEIHPSRQYRRIYKDMEEAINLLYFAADYYRDMKAKQLRTTSADTLFRQYAKEASGGDVPAARAVFRRHHTTLASLMVDGKEGINWDQTKLYSFFLDTANHKEEEDVEEAARTPVPSEDEEEATTRRLAGKGKSTLRPTTGSLSSKAAARQAALAASDTGSDSPTLKRKGVTNGASSQSKRHGRPPRNLSAEKTDEDLLKLDGSDDDDAGTGVLTVDPDVKKPHRLQSPNCEPAKSYEIAISKTALPSFAANLPGDVWSCGYDGCSHKVFDASSDQSHEIIREHYKKHAQECQAAIDLVQREHRPYLPVSHLIKRIRDMAEQQKAMPSEADASGSALDLRLKSREPLWMQELQKYPHPIKQNY